MTAAVGFPVSTGVGAFRPGFTVFDATAAAAVEAAAADCFLVDTETVDGGLTPGSKFDTVCSVLTPTDAAVADDVDGVVDAAERRVKR